MRVTISVHEEKQLSTKSGQCPAFLYIQAPIGADNETVIQ
jgi:hypothetical protein